MSINIYLIVSGIIFDKLKLIFYKILIQKNIYIILSMGEVIFILTIVGIIVSFALA